MPGSVRGKSDTVCCVFLGLAFDYSDVRSILQVFLPKNRTLQNQHLFPQRLKTVPPLVQQHQLKSLRPARFLIKNGNVEQIRFRRHPIEARDVPCLRKGSSQRRSHENPQSRYDKYTNDVTTTTLFSGEKSATLPYAPTVLPWLYSHRIIGCHRDNLHTRLDTVPSICNRS